MCGGEVSADNVRPKPLFRSLKELQADFEQKRPQSVLRPLQEQSREFVCRGQPASPNKALRPLQELTADFEAQTRSVPSPTRRGAEEAASCQEASYVRDEMLAVLACMQLVSKVGERGPGIRTIKIGPPPGLCDSCEDAEPSEEPVASPEALQADEASLPVPEEDTATTAELDPYLSQGWELRPEQEQALEEQDFWWYMSQEKQCYTEDLWDLSENFVGYQEDPFWGYPQGFNDGLLSMSTWASYDYGFADKSGVPLDTYPKGNRTSSSTASTEKESDAESRGDEVDARQAICW